MLRIGRLLASIYLLAFVSGCGSDPDDCRATVIPDGATWSVNGRIVNSETNGPVAAEAVIDVIYAKEGCVDCERAALRFGSIKANKDGEFYFSSAFSGSYSFSARVRPDYCSGHSVIVANAPIVADIDLHVSDLACPGTIYY